MNELFSRQSKEYARYRPNYPTTLIIYLVSLCQEKEEAWDFGTGNGQVAVALTPYFQKITASDSSEEQLKYAPKHRRIKYVNCPTEESVVKKDTIDLVTVAEAFHWFDPDVFFDKINTGLKLNGVLAIWSYGELQSSNPVIKIVNEFKNNTLKDFWHPKTKNTQSNPFISRKHFHEFNSPGFSISRDWDVFSLIGYIESWSATNLYRLENSVQFDKFKRTITEAFFPKIIQFYWEIKLYTGRRII